jgi:hypothetical protein
MGRAETQKTGVLRLTKGEPLEQESLSLVSMLNRGAVSPALGQRRQRCLGNQSTA